MALPKLNTIEYFCKLPISGREAKYRPFTVGEQKVLLQALEDGEVKTISNTVVNLVDSCCTLTESKDTVRDLSNTDLEYLFLQVRIKSVGEITNVVLGCENQPTCDGQSTVEVDLSSINVEGEVKDNKIMLTDSVGVTLKVPNFNEIQATIGDISEIGSNDIFSVLAQSIESIFDAEEVHSKGDFTTKELNDFVESLNSNQFKMVENFFTTMPKLSHTVKVINPNTKVESEIKIEGLQSFFG